MSILCVCEQQLKALASMHICTGLPDPSLLDQDHHVLSQIISTWVYSYYISLYTTLTNFSMKYLMMCKVYTDVGGIK